MKFPELVKKIPPRTIFYGLFFGAGSSMGLEGLIQSAEVVGLLEIGIQLHLYSLREKYFNYDSNKD